MPSALGAARDTIRTTAAEIRAGTEMLALGAQHDRAHLRRAVPHLEHIGDLGDHVGVDEVVRSAPDLDRADDTGLFDADVLVTRHGSLPCSSAGMHRVRPYPPVAAEETGPWQRSTATAWQYTTKCMDAAPPSCCRTATARPVGCGMARSLRCRTATNSSCGTCAVMVRATIPTIPPHIPRRPRCRIWPPFC